MPCWKKVSGGFYWNFGNSPRVLAIEAHLTPRERRHYLLYSLVGCIAYLGGFAGTLPLLMFLSDEFQLRMPGMLAVMLGCAVVFGLGYGLIFRGAANFLRSTAWSKAQGWDKEVLPLTVWEQAKHKQRPRI